MTIEIKALSKHYKNQVVVDQLTLSIEKGELFALLGQNAAGKTTTIKMLCGLLTPTSGDAILEGESIVFSQTAVKKIINISPQETAVAPNLTVQENLLLMGQIYGDSKQIAQQHAVAQMDLFGLTSVKEKRAKVLSGGYLRRLSVAMAMMSKPQILFLDEPTLGMDVRARRDLWRILLQIKGDVTIVVTTHYLEEIEMLANRVGIMNQGKLCALGTVQQLIDETGKPTLTEVFLELTKEVLH
ncbi:ATP-binding cassette domain-containing protein [Lysinibacillus mangiferihumi]|uniref:ATP-binding cassette domain-containing protein n=1 Tax=Lysinibacillus mangiferihumi TaxID=1130819 RepID=A0A4U2YZM3_9BACI|nr:ABC transporter A family member [Lysinibacillus mangiferihumi]TKI67098.1 ATP-binding cassette domain-containing protein [Lysinibacillus mangiferihumi]